VTKNGTAVQGKANSFVLGPAVIHTHTAGAHVENAENAQDEEARNPLPIDDRKDTLDDASAQQPEACTAARPQHVKRSDNTGNDYTIDTDNDYTIDDTATAHFLFLIPPHNHGINPSAPTQAGAHVEHAENAQEEEARNPLPIDDRKDTLDDATDPKDDNALAATSGAHHPRPRLYLRRQERRLRRRQPQPRLRQRLRPRHARAGRLALAQ